MPVLGKGAKYYDYVPIFPYSHERIDAAINFYKAKGIDNIVLIADQFACCPRLCRIMMPPLGLSASLSIKILKISLPFLSLRYSTSPSM
jgi:hypothetical protein